MAITHKFVTPHGIEVAKAYTAIKTMNYERGRETGFHVLADVYLSRITRKEAKDPIGQVTFPFVYDPLGPNIYVQAYIAMKALPELAGANDAQEEPINYTPISSVEPAPPQSFISKVAGLFK